MLILTPKSWNGMPQDFIGNLKGQLATGDMNILFSPQQNTFVISLQL